MNQALTSHRERIQLQQEQIQSLTQLLNTRRNSNLDNHCTVAIDRLIELLDRHQQSHGQVYNLISSIKEAKNIQNLTLDGAGEIVTYLNLELDVLAQRLGIAKSVKLLTAAHNKVAWLKLMISYPDPDGYQWQFPGLKRGLYHNKKMQAIGIKAVNLSPDKLPLN